jgi:YD repeat-containing protein
MEIKGTQYLFWYGDLEPFEYDKNDLLSKLTDPKSNAASRAYDGLNRPVTITDALTNDADFERDAGGNLTGFTDQRALN